VKWIRDERGNLASGEFEIRKYEDRYNLRRVIVVRGYKLFRGAEKIGTFDLLRDAKAEAKKIEQGAFSMSDGSSAASGQRKAEING
jgi:hypothetical protein